MFPIPPPSPDDQKTLRYQYQKAWEKMQADWDKENEEAGVTPFTCYQKSTVQYAASTVSYDLSQIQYIDSEFSAFLNDADRNIATIREGIANLRNIYPTYKARYKAYQQIVPSYPDSSFTAGSIDSLEHWIAPSMQRVTQRLSAARAGQADYDQKAHDLEEKAKVFPDSLTCDG
jgi:hypothetical protein